MSGQSKAKSGTCDTVLRAGVWHCTNQRALAASARLFDLWARESKLAPGQLVSVYIFPEGWALYTEFLGLTSRE